MVEWTVWILFCDFIEYFEKVTVFLGLLEFFQRRNAEIDKGGRLSHFIECFHLQFDSAAFNYLTEMFSLRLIQQVDKLFLLMRG